MSARDINDARTHMSLAVAVLDFFFIFNVVFLFAFSLSVGVVAGSMCLERVLSVVYA